MSTGKYLCGRSAPPLGGALILPHENIIVHYYDELAMYYSTVVASLYMVFCPSLSYRRQPCANRPKRQNGFEVRVRREEQINTVWLVDPKKKCKVLPCYDDQTAVELLYLL